uniref:Uncharacterized protein n=1 Tax=Meloidogyne javanica TaxID=6303 RepID=A0A915LHL3_MELJA
MGNMLKVLIKLWKRQSPTCLLRPLKEELKIDGKSSEFKPLLYGQFNSAPVIPPDVNCPPPRRRHRPRSSIPAEINGNTLSGNEGEFFVTATLRKDIISGD